jgi:hypothetical protein
VVFNRVEIIHAEAGEHRHGTYTSKEEEIAPMALKRIDKRGSCEARDSNGNKYTVIKWVQVISAAHQGDANAEIDGITEFSTSDGMHVNWISKGKYKIVQTGQELISTDPSAP